MTVWARPLYHLILILLAMGMVWAYASDWYGEPMLDLVQDQVYGRIERPFVYRQFVPLVARVLIAVVGLRADVAVILIIFLSAVGFAYALHFLYRAFWARTPFADLTVLLGLELLFLMIVKDKKIYDMSTVFLFTWALGLLARRRFWEYAVVYLIACLNRETTFLLAILFALHYFGQLDKRAWFLWLVYQGLVYLLVRVVLIYAFAGNPGSLVYYRPAENVQLYLDKPLLSVVFVVAMALILYLVFRNWKSKPRFLRVGFLVFFIILLVSFFLAGVSFEIRVFLEVYPLALLLALPSVVEMVRLKPDPFIPTSGARHIAGREGGGNEIPVA